MSREPQHERSAEPSRSPDERWTGRSTPRDTTPVLAGIDVLAAEGFARLRGKRVGLLTNQTGRSRDGESTIDLLARAPGRHARRAASAPSTASAVSSTTRCPSSRDEKTGLPIHSLYGDTQAADRRRCSKAIDTLVVDLQDIGARFYTYPATVGVHDRGGGAARRSRVVVLDRPEPGERLRRRGADAQDASAVGFNGYCRCRSGTG